DHAPHLRLPVRTWLPAGAPHWEADQYSINVAPVDRGAYTLSGPTSGVPPRPLPSASRDREPREALRLHLALEDLRERIRGEFRRIVLHRPLLRLGHQHLRRDPLLGTLSDAVLEMLERLLLPLLCQAVREGAVLPRDGLGVAVHHDPAVLHPDDP